jgi:hypothetical protein
MAVTVRCTEAWRFLPPWTDASPSRENVLSYCERPIPLDDYAAGLRFATRFPRDSAASEALTVAWRYELVVSSRTSHCPDQRATLTPLLFEAA